MVLVEFKVPEDKAYMVGDTKFYVRKDKEVAIKPPLVVKTDENYKFEDWSVDDLTKKIIGTYSEDTEINSDAGKPDILIRVSSAGANFVEITKLTDGAEGHLVLTRGGEEYKFTPTTLKIRTRVRRRIVESTMHCFDLSTQGLTLQANDKISVYAIKDNFESDVRNYIIR